MNYHSQSKIPRRGFLRGTLKGAAVAVALPFLNVFLNTSGNAVAATGAPLPRRFGTWFFGCGMNPLRWNPATQGSDWELTPELAPITDLRDRMNILSGFSVLMDGEANQVHRTGVFGTLCGGAPKKTDEVEGPSLDVLISDEIGTKTRFRSIEMAATGNSTHSNSLRDVNNVNPAEPSPLSLYTRIFGSGFADPNAAEFTPDPRLLLRKSALAIVAEDRKRLERQLGQSDRTRLDQYFTSLRQLEQQIELQLRKPPPLQACSVPPAPVEEPTDTEIEHVMSNHALMAQMLALALACDQTRVFNMVFSNRASSLRRPGSSDTHHTLTHEEPRDPNLGYQPKATYFVLKSMEAWANLVATLDAVPEGDGTLLDNCLVMAHSETSEANTHSVVGLPFMIAGTAGGRMRTGLHVRGVGESTSRVGLTMQQLMGLNV
ncbi:MAG: DUF1552 domain-containing protein, partial [Gammaproteobacteria bacterium]|nr:DUF1552 domain-containing protein [Gammaproteobacteria bacterium]